MPAEPRVESLRRAIRAFLDEMELKYEETDGSFRLFFGTLGESGVVWVFPQPWGERATIAQVISVIVRDVRIDDDLAVWVFDKNSQLLFGKITIARDANEVRFEHPLLGDFLNASELKCAIGAAAATAKDCAEEIVERWGGHPPARRAPTEG